MRSGTAPPSETLAAVTGLLRQRLGELGTLPGGLDLRLPSSVDGGAAAEVRDALEEVLPDGGSG